MGKEILHFDGFVCPTHEISAYIDGELEPREELSLETHIFSCETCFAELNYQKEFLNELSHSIKLQGDIELPANFAETIVAAAESSVSGLRKPSERSNAFVICAVLLFSLVFALSLDSGKLLAGTVNLFEKVAALAGFLFQLIYSFVIGFGALLRVVGGGITVPGALSFIIIGVFFVVFLVFARTLLRFRRT